MELNIENAHLVLKKYLGETKYDHFRLFNRQACYCCSRKSSQRKWQKTETYWCFGE